MEFLRTCYQVSTRGASKTLPSPRSTLYYRSRKAEQAPLRHRIKEIAAIRVRYGYRRIQCATKARDASGGRFHPDN